MFFDHSDLNHIKEDLNYGETCKIGYFGVREWSLITCLGGGVYKMGAGDK